MSSATQVIVGMSGGVDSAVAALRLREAGYHVQGLFMANWEDDDDYCTTAQDYQDARRVAADLDIALHRVNFAEGYRERVFRYFLDDYRAGRTPNPDVLCNREIKFGLCLDYVQRLGGQCFATGHYARVLPAEDGPALYQGVDPAKDQSYFLHAVEQQRLARVLFPLGDLHKQEVRELARRAGLPVHDKPDSTGICFIGERPFTAFLSRYLPDQPGVIESLDGQPLGRHRGLSFYTLGQRSGLTIGGARGRAQEPWYVARKDYARNTLIAVQRHEQHCLDARTVLCGPLNWLCTPRTGRFTAQVKLRYRQPAQPATLTIPVRNTAFGSAVSIEFATPQRAATPGQFAVLYDGERCLGGGVIDQALYNLQDNLQASPHPVSSAAVVEDI
jgi:tRNA-uridine 2-sulfurtransferase